MKLTPKNFDIKDNYNPATIISLNEVLESDTRLANLESKKEISDISSKDINLKNNCVISSNEVFESDTRFTQSESKKKVSDISGEDIESIQNIQLKNKDKKCILWSCSEFITNRLFKYAIHHRGGNLPNDFLFTIQLDKDIIITKVTSTFIKNFREMNYAITKVKELDQQEFDNLVIIQTSAIEQALSRCISHTSYDDNSVASSTFMDMYNEMDNQYDSLIVKECNNVDLNNKLFNDTFIDMLRDCLISNFRYYG